MRRSRRSYGVHPLVNLPALQKRMARARQEHLGAALQVGGDPAVDAVVSQAVVLRLRRVLAAVSAAAHYRTGMTYDAAARAVGRAKLRVASNPRAELEAFEKRCALENGSAARTPAGAASGASSSSSSLGVPLPTSPLAAGDTLSAMLGHSGGPRTVAPPPPLAPDAAAAGARVPERVFIEPEDFFAQRAVVGNHALDTLRINALNRLRC